MYAWQLAITKKTMAFAVSDYIPPQRGGSGGDGGDGTPPAPFPIPVWIDVEAGVVVGLPPQYQVVALLFMVFRNGVLQRPQVDFVRIGSSLSFIQAFTPGENVSLVAYGFSV
jgi:hypothetical protein